MLNRSSIIVVTMMAISALAIIIQLQFTATLAASALHLVSEWAMIEITLTFTLAVSVLGTETTITSVTASRTDDQFGSVFVAYLIITLLILSSIIAPAIFLIFHFFLEFQIEVIYQVIFSVSAVTLTSVAAMLLRASRHYIHASLLEKAHWWGLGATTIIIGISSQTFLLNVFELFFYVTLIILIYLGVLIFSIFNKYDIEFRESKKIIRQIIQNSSTFLLSLNGIIVALYERLDQVILGTMLGREMLAAYFICFKLSFLVRFMTKSINQFFLPLLVRTRAESSQNNVVIMIKQNIRISSALALPVVALAIFYSPLFLQYFGIIQYNALVTAQILTISGFLSISNLVIFGFLGTQQGGKLVLSNGVMSLLVQLFTLVLLLPSLSLVAPAVARITAVVVGNINAQRYAKQKGFHVNLLNSSVIGAVMLGGLIIWHVSV